MFITIRPIEAADEDVWRQHWHAYNEFYQRTADITEDITATTFARFLQPNSSISCGVAVAPEPSGAKVVGFVTYFPHPSTYLIEEKVYLEDLYVDPEYRNVGTGRNLIEYVYAEADKKGYKGVYWHTQHFNHRAQLLYTKVAKKTDFVMYARE